MSEGGCFGGQVDKQRRQADADRRDGKKPCPHRGWEAAQRFIRLRVRGRPSAAKRAGPGADLDAAPGNEDDVTARIVSAVGHWLRERGPHPTRDVAGSSQNHAVSFPRRIWWRARDAAIALGLLEHADALAQPETVLRLRRQSAKLGSSGAGTAKPRGLERLGRSQNGCPCGRPRGRVEMRSRALASSYHRSTLTEREQMHKHFVRPNGYQVSFPRRRTYTMIERRGRAPNSRAGGQYRSVEFSVRATAGKLKP